MFKMRAFFAIGGMESVAIRVKLYVLRAVIEHRFKRYHHPGHELNSLARFAKVWDIRVFMNIFTHSMTGENFHNAITMVTDKRLNRVTYVSRGVSTLRYINADFKRSFSRINELLAPPAYFTYRHSNRHVRK